MLISDVSVRSDSVQRNDSGIGPIRNESVILVQIVSGSENRNENRSELANAGRELNSMTQVQMKDSLRFTILYDSIILQYLCSTCRGTTDEFFLYL